MQLCYSSNKKVHYDWISLLNSYKKYIKKNHTVLGIGTSTIKRTRDLAKHCKLLKGIELYPERKPKNFQNIKYTTGDWQTLSKHIPVESIDIAVSSHVIEHVSDDLKAINQLHTVLKPKGTALINTPNRKRLIRSIIETFFGSRKFPFGEHVREYTEKDLIKLLEKSKFGKYKIYPVVIGVHGGPVYLYKEHVPKKFRRFANFWEIHLFKN